jgi:HlyD family secretion protein
MTSGPKKKRSLKWLWVTAALLLVAGSAGGFWGYQKFSKKPLTVQTEKTARRNLTELITATGKVQPFLSVKISPEVSGEIIELPVKEGQAVKKGDLLVRIKPDFYIASRNSAEASFKSAEAGRTTAIAQAAKAESEFKRNQELFEKRLVSESIYDEFRTAFDVARSQANAASHQIEMARQSLKKAEEDLLKCTIYSPVDGTISKLISEKGERVVGTGMMAGTEIMTVADLNEMEARVEVGEVDVVLVQLGQRTRLEVDSFRDRKFTGFVTQIANSAKTTGLNSQQEATKFEVRIRIADKDRFLPGMSVTAEIETRYRTNVLTVPIQSVTTRLPKGAKPDAQKPAVTKAEDKELEQEFADLTQKKDKSGPKPIDVVFTVAGDKAKSVPVKRGLSDESYYEILEGLTEGQEIVTGSYKAIARELEDEKLAQVDNTKKDAKPEEKK